MRKGRAMSVRTDRVRLWVAGLLILPTLAAAQSWPEPPAVPNAFTAAQLEAAAKLETGPSCRPGRDTIYCTDPEVQAYRQRLHEAVAAALARMPDTEGRRDIAPSSVDLFHRSLNFCRRAAESACFNNPEGLREEYPALSDLPEIAGDACTPLAEKACTIVRLTERIAEWNARNTEADAAPVVAFHDPGFDCTDTRIGVALQTICGDAELSTLHRSMVAQIVALRQRDDARLLPPDHRRVLGDLRRETWDCRTDKDCIRRAIAQRVVDIAAASNALAEAVQLSALQAEEEVKRREAEELQREAEFQLRVQNVLPEAMRAFPPESMLRHIVLQEFAAADQIARRIAVEIWEADFARTVRILAPGMSDSLREAAISNRKNIALAAYALTRYELLGACGDQVTTITRLVSERQVSRNIYNVIISDIPAQYSSVDTPVNFARFVENTNFERGGRYFSSEVDAMGSCDTELLILLEESLLAYARWRP